MGDIDNITANVSVMGNTTVGPEESSYQQNLTLFWIFVAVSLLIAIVAIIGNGLVIYIAHRANNSGPLRYLDGVVKSLAFTDFAFGLVGTPLIILNYHRGEI